VLRGVLDDSPPHLELISAAFNLDRALGARITWI
jgi:hypothetical protein